MAYYITNSDTGREFGFPSKAAYEAAMDWYNSHSKSELLDWFNSRKTETAQGLLADIFTDETRTTMHDDWADTLMAYWAWNEAYNA